MYFGHKHVETGPNYSYKLATFLKHHTPLNFIIAYIKFDILYYIKIKFYTKIRKSVIPQVEKSEA